MLKAVFFDLDGTLLPLDEDEFIKIYFKLLCNHVSKIGYEKEKFIKTIYDGTKAMYLNDGRITNEEVFWNHFVLVYGKDKLLDKSYVDRFYEEDFKLTKSSCKPNPLAKEIIDFCKNNNLKVFLTTNPIFPRQATLTRMSYVGLTGDDFELVTSYENSCFCKPNPAYFKTILAQYDLKSDEVILFGNNTYEDGECSYACGIKCFMVGNYLIHHPKTFHKFDEISMDEVIPIISSLL